MMNKTNILFTKLHPPHHRSLQKVRLSTSASALTQKKREWDLDDPKEKELYELYHPETITPNKRGMDLLKAAAFNKGMAFTLYERQYLGLHGLLPPAFMTEEQQAYRVINKLRQQPDDLARFVQMDSLQDRNEKLFYRVLCDNIKELMPVVYTPTVGQACQEFGIIYRTPKGLYVTINDNSISKIYQILCNWPNQDVKAIVVTDGERILGLGDLGAYGIGIPVGKLALYVALAGIQPRWCLPVLVDVGTDNQKLLNDPFYIGLRRNRVRGPEYDSLMDNFMKACHSFVVDNVLLSAGGIKACTKRYGPDTLIQFEDFGNKNAYRLLDRYQDKYCMFNDDIQGTASVVVAGLLASARVTKRKMSETRYVFFGAGGAATGVAEMCVRQMESEGLSHEEACSRIYMMDIDGLITTWRSGLDPRHAPFAKSMSPRKDLLSVIGEVKPGALIGASTVKGAFNEAIIAAMAKINQSPIIFALSNPTSKAECTAEEAYRVTNGSVLFASGSPFKNVEWKNRLYKPGQGNNAYVKSSPISLRSIVIGDATSEAPKRKSSSEGPKWRMKKLKLALIALLLYTLLPSNPSFSELAPGCSDLGCVETINDQAEVWDSMVLEEGPKLVVTAMTTASSEGLPSTAEQSDPSTTEGLKSEATSPIEVVVATVNSSEQPTGEQQKSFLSQYWWVFLVPLAIPFLAVLIVVLCKLCRRKRRRSIDDEESSVGARYKVDEDRAVIVSEVVSVSVESPNADNGMMI